MQSPDDNALLREYVETGSDEAFAELVRRHINLVYSVALRRAGNSSQAEEIAQAVFIILAKKAGALRHEKALSSWLFQTTRLTANNFIRSEMRRYRREQEAHMQSLSDQSADVVWQQIGPVLDDAMDALGAKDRRAILLRYYEGRSLRDVGMVLGVSEDASEKRVARALEKLRKSFFKRGLPSTPAAIAGSISANSVQAAPAGLAKTISAVAVAKGAAASASILTLVKGALKVMAWTQAKTAIVVCAGVLLAAGATTITVKQIQEHTPYPWEAPQWRPDLMNKVPPQVKIVPAKFPMGGMGMLADGRMLGIGQPLAAFFPNAYHFDWTRTVFEVQLPTNHYDYIANLPQGSDVALQHAIEKQFGLVTTREIINTNVLLLTRRNVGTTGLTPATSSLSHPTQIGGSIIGQFSCTASPISYLAECLLEPSFHIPVVDGTGLTGTFDFTLKWNEHDWEPKDLDALKQNLLDQLGMELVPTNMPIEMLVVKRAK